MTTNWSLVGGAVGGALIAVLGSTLVICLRIKMRQLGHEDKSLKWWVFYCYWRARVGVRMRWLGIKGRPSMEARRRHYRSRRR